MSVIGRGRQPDAQNAALADGCRDVALLAGPVGVMLVRRQMRGQLGRVVDGRSHQTVSPQPLDEAIPEHVVVAEAERQQPEGNTMCRQEQGIRQLIDGSGHVAEDEAGAEPVGGRRWPRRFSAVSGRTASETHAQSRAGNSLGRSPPETTPEPTGAHCSMKLRTRSASCQMSSYCCWVIGMTICLAPRGTCVEGVFRSRSTCRVFGRASILASPSLERSRMTKMPPAGYPAFLQYLQSGRVSVVQ